MTTREKNNDGKKHTERRRPYERTHARHNQKGKDGGKEKERRADNTTRHDTNETNKYPPIISSVCTSLVFVYLFTCHSELSNDGEDVLLFCVIHAIRHAWIY